MRRPEPEYPESPNEKAWRELREALEDLGRALDHTFHFRRPLYWLNAHLISLEKWIKNKTGAWF